MNTQFTQRSVVKIRTPQKKSGMNHLHQIRELVSFSDAALTDPFLMLMEDWFPRGVFANHPHRGMETVTYSLSGRLDHYDNRGNKGSILPGEVQWMTAGRGLIHNEQPAEGDTVHSLQLWVNLPKAVKMVEPRYQELARDNIIVARGDGSEVRIFSGSYGAVQSATKNYAAVTYLDVNLAPGAEVSPDFPADYNAFLVVLEGAGYAGADEREIEAGNVVFLSTSVDSASQVRLRASQRRLRLLVIAGKPLREPIAAGGPFVMNTKEEIEQAFTDYRAGLF
ncbi:MAG: pirin [Burkholderia sp.]|nr:pirin [Burkholderia sp.]